MGKNFHWLVVFYGISALVGYLMANEQFVNNS